MRIARRAVHLGDFVAGNFVVPQTPVVLTSPTVRRYSNGIAEFVPGKFVVPQNPVSDAQSGSAGMGCGCNSGCGGGLGQTTGTIDSVWTSLESQTIWGFNAGYVLAGLLIAAPVLAYTLANRKR
jgi:hypothetical protein